MRISDWSSDVCSSDLLRGVDLVGAEQIDRLDLARLRAGEDAGDVLAAIFRGHEAEVERTDAGGSGMQHAEAVPAVLDQAAGIGNLLGQRQHSGAVRSEEHTSELQSLMRISYAVLCLKKKKQTNNP